MDKEQKAIERMRLAAQMSETYYQKPLIVTTSGGKDSDCLLYTSYNPLSPEPYGTFPDSFFFSVTAYSVYQKSFALSRTFFNLFFRFSSRSFSFPNFSGRHPFRSSLFSISNPKLFVKNFFLLFSAFSAAHFRSSFTILYPPPLCQVLPPPFFL